MAATPYKPVVFSSESLSQAKLQQLANNQQWLFENTPRTRYVGNGLTRDSSIKMMSGKISHGTAQVDYLDVPVYFGSFFTAGCRPIVVATVEGYTYGLRHYTQTRGLSNGEIDHTGFIAHVVSHELVNNTSTNWIKGTGWVHWTAVGY
jgi:hypothetical protein